MLTEKRFSFTIPTNFWLKNVANPSFSHRSSHQAIVTRTNQQNKVNYSFFFSGRQSIKEIHKEASIQQ